MVSHSRNLISSSVFNGFEWNFDSIFRGDFNCRFYLNVGIKPYVSWCIWSLLWALVGFSFLLLEEEFIKELERKGSEGAKLQVEISSLPCCNFHLQIDLESSDRAAQLDIWTLYSTSPIIFLMSNWYEFIIICSLYLILYVISVQQLKYREHGSIL